MRSDFKKLIKIVKSRSAFCYERQIKVPKDFFVELIQELEEESCMGKFWCWHNWEFLFTNFTIGDKFQCKKCGRIKYED